MNWFFSFDNYAFVEDSHNKTDPSRSSINISDHEKVKDGLTSVRRDTGSFDSEYDLIDTDYVNADLSTDVLKLQMYDELVQRFGPDEQFSEMLRSQRPEHLKLGHRPSKADTLPSNIITHATDYKHNEGLKFETLEKVEVLLVSQVPETHRSSYQCLIMPPTPDNP